MGAGRPETRPRAPPSVPARQGGPRNSIQGAEQPQYAARSLHLPHLSPSPSRDGPEAPKRPGPAAGTRALTPTGPQTRLAAPGPAVRGRDGPRRPPLPWPAGPRPPTPLPARTGGPTTWRPGSDPLAGPSGTRGLRALGCPRPASPPAGAHPEDEIEDEEQVFDALGAALHPHGGAGGGRPVWRGSVLGSGARGLGTW